METQPVETTLYSLDAAPPCSPQRRNSERHVSLLRVGTLVASDRRELCLIRNISAGGMLVRIYSSIRAGERVSVELREGEAMTGVVRWTKDDCVGLAFDEPIDVIGLISGSSESKRPRMPRIEVTCAAWVRDGAQVHRVSALDISQGGVKIATAATLPVCGQVVVTMIDLAPCPGVVRWRDGDAYGISFNRPLGLSDLVNWLQGQQQRQRLAAAS